MGRSNIRWSDYLVATVMEVASEARALSNRLPPRRAIAWATLAVIVIAVTALFVLRPAGVAGTTSAGDVTPGMTIIPEGQRAMTAEVSGQTLTGDRWSLSDQRGHVVVLNVWASWCAPCRDEAPVLAGVARSRAVDGVRFAGIDIRDRDDAARAFEARYGITYPSLVDRDVRILLQLRDLPPSVIPSTLVVDARGRVAGWIIGRVTSTALNLVIDAAIGPAASGAPMPGASADAGWVLAVPRH